MIEASTKAVPAKAAKKVHCRAIYPFADRPVGEVDFLWGIGFVHECIKQNGEDFHILTADLDAKMAAEMIANGRVEKL